MVTDRAAPAPAEQSQLIANVKSAMTPTLEGDPTLTQAMAGISSAFETNAGLDKVARRKSCSRKSLSVAGQDHTAVTRASRERMHPTHSDASTLEVGPLRISQPLIQTGGRMCPERARIVADGLLRKKIKALENQRHFASMACASFVRVDPHASAQSASCTASNRMTPRSAEDT